MKKPKKDSAQVQKEIGMELMKKNICLLREEFDSLDEMVHNFVSNYIVKSEIIESLILSVKRGLCPEKFEILHSPVEPVEDLNIMNLKPILKTKKLRTRKSKGTNE